MRAKLTTAKASLLGSLLSIFFLFFVLILGLIQPDYNHLNHTISVLVSGQYGWIQVVNFMVLALAVFLINFSLKQTLIQKAKRLFNLVSSVSILGIISVSIFPADKLTTSQSFQYSTLSTPGKIHFFWAAIMSVIISLEMLLIIQNMKQKLDWRSLVIPSYLSFAFCTACSILWFYFNHQGIFYSLRGIFEKVIILTALIWLNVICFKLWSTQKN